MMRDIKRLERAGFEFDEDSNSFGREFSWLGRDDFRLELRGKGDRFVVVGVFPEGWSGYMAGKEEELYECSNFSLAVKKAIRRLKEYESLEAELAA